MHYTVYVERVDGSSRIVLTQTTDLDAASELIYALVRAVQGNALSVGVQIAEAPEGESARLPAAPKAPSASPPHGRAGRAGG